MSYNDEVVIEDKTADKEEDPRYYIGLALIVIGAGLGWYYGGGNFIAGGLIGAWAASQVIGIKVSKKTRDKTLKIKDFYRPLWYRLLCYCFIIVGSFMALFKTTGDTKSYYTLIITGITIASLVYTLFGNWNSIFTKIKSILIKEEPPTEDELLLTEFDNETLPQAGLSATAIDSGLEVKPKILKKQLDDNGRAQVIIEPISGRQKVNDYLYRAEEIADSWGVRKVMVESKFDNELKKKTITITALIKESLFEGVQKWEPMENIPDNICDYSQALPMGFYSDNGKKWTLDLNEKNFVIGGRPGSGKSSFANALLAHLIRHPDVRVMFIDLKNGAESGKWEGNISGTIDNSQPDGISSVRAWLGLALDEQRARYADMKSKGITNAIKGGYLGPDNPLKILIIDESSDLFSGDEVTKDEAKDIRDKLKKFIQQGRAAGYILIMATQTPTEENIPRVIRNSASDKMAFGMDFAAIAPTLGADYSPTKGPDPTELQIGEMVIRNSKMNSGVKIKTLFMTDEDRDEIISESVIGGTTWLEPDLEKTWVKYQKYLAKNAEKTNLSRAAQLEAEMEASMLEQEEPNDSINKNKVKGKPRLSKEPIIDDSDFKWL